MLTVGKMKAILAQFSDEQPVAVYCERKKCGIPEVDKRVMLDMLFVQAIVPHSPWNSVPWNKPDQSNWIVGIEVHPENADMSKRVPMKKEEEVQ